jgi:hypothetical protein
VLRDQLPVPVSGEKKISESCESGEWDSLGGFRWNVRKMEMKPTFMARSCHEFGQGVSLANAAWPKTLKIFWLPLKKCKKSAGFLFRESFAPSYIPAWMTESQPWRGKFKAAGTCPRFSAPVFSAIRNQPQ